MEKSFWHERWEHNQIGFHEGEPNRLLVRHFEALSLKPGARVFLPLCGKTRDIHWLLSKGYRVAGAELSPLAIQQLFGDLDLAPQVSAEGKLDRYQAENIDIFVGDIFDLTADMLGPVDAAYDRAALVALPDDMRGRYAGHVAAITASAPQLLVAFEYDQSRMDGPPFSISQDEVVRRYASTYEMALLERTEVEGGLKGQCEAQEAVWLLSPKR